MIELLYAEIRPIHSRIGIARVKYYGLSFCCDICVYRQEKLWLRMPEIWIDKENKKRFLYWENQDESDKFQILVLKKVCDSLGLDLEKAIKIRLDYIANGKKLKLKRKDVMIQEKNAAG